MGSDSTRTGRAPARAAAPPSAIEAAGDGRLGAVTGGNNLNLNGGLWHEVTITRDH